MSYSTRAAYWDCFFGDRTAEIEFWGTLAARYGKNVLALMTATGEVAAALAKRGLNVTGVDITSEMVAVAQKRAAGLENARFIHGDIRALELANTGFDFAFIGTGDFHHFLQTADQAAALENIHRCLRPGGGLALDLFPPPRKGRPETRTGGTFDALRLPEEPGVKVWKDSETHYQPETRRLHITQKMYVRRDGGTETYAYDFELQLFSRAEIREKFETVGFRVTAEFGSYAMDGWKEGANSWIVAAEKV